MLLHYFYSIFLYKWLFIGPPKENILSNHRELLHLQFVPDKLGSIASVWKVRYDKKVGMLGSDHQDLNKPIFGDHFRTRSSVGSDLSGPAWFIHTSNHRHTEQLGTQLLQHVSCKHLLEGEWQWISLAMLSCQLCEDTVSPKPNQRKVKQLREKCPEKQQQYWNLIGP